LHIKISDAPLLDAEQPKVAPHVTASLRVAVMPRSGILELWVFIKGGVLGKGRFASDRCPSKGWAP